MKFDSYSRFFCSDSGLAFLPAKSATRRKLAAALVLGFNALLLGGVSPALAQTYPSRPVTVVVPQAAGGGMDAIARAVTLKMGTLLNTSFVIDNKPGAGGNIGAAQVVKAQADGHTILLGQTSQFAINPHLYTQMSFDPLKDLVPVVMLADAPNVIVVGADSPFKTLADIVAAAKASKNMLDFATPGAGTPSHLIGEMFQDVAGIKLVHVPYKGAPAAITDTIAGRTAFMLSSIPSALTQIRNGKMRAIAVSADKRSPTLPDVPTIAEAGFPKGEFNFWVGLLAPAGTPKEIVARLNDEINKALATPEIKERLENNLKILEALEEEYVLQNPEQNKDISEEIKQQLEIQQKVIQENSLEKQNKS